MDMRNVPVGADLASDYQVWFQIVRPNQRSRKGYPFSQAHEMLKGIRTEVARCRHGRQYTTGQAPVAAVGLRG
jgi:hypothetical protein